MQDHGPIITFGQTDPKDAAETIALFEAAFTASEGADEGRMVAGLARDLWKTQPADLFVFEAREDDALLGCVMASRLRFPEDPRTVFILSPVAVAGAHQRRGVGQALLRHGLAALAAGGVDVAVTYGDPAYYGRVGFQPITAEDAMPPHPLSQPVGWIAQSLTGRPLGRLMGPSRTVPALDDPAYW